MLGYGFGSLSIATNGQTAVTTVAQPGPPAIMGYTTSQLFDRANWERDYLHSDTTSKSLHHIVFPASHDAGMYEDYSGGSGAAALAQDENLYGQLTDGVRYFDLRPDYDFRFWHGPSPKSIIHIQGGSVQSALNDVVKFLKEGHHEVVILKFSHFAFDSTAQYPKLLSMIQTTLGPWTYVRAAGDNRRIADIPLKELLKAGHGIVIPIIDTGDASTGFQDIYTYRDYEDTDNPQNGQFTAFDQWSDKDDYGLMRADQLNRYYNFTGTMLHDQNLHCDEFLLSWTLTPIAHVYQSAPIADSYLGSVMSGIQPNKYGKIPNILYVDFAEWADPVSVANQMNARL